jgi:hypothetical protein
MSHIPDDPDDRSPVSTYPNAIAFGGGGDDNDDAGALSDSSPDITLHLWIWLSRENSDCVRLYCSAARPKEIRVCACHGPTCKRLLPGPHKGTPDGLDTHALDGWFLAFPARMGSQIRDGTFASFRTNEQRRSDLQPFSDQNVAAAHALREGSSDNSRSFHHEEEGPRGTPSPARGPVTFAAPTTKDSLGSTRVLVRYKTPPPQADRTDPRDAAFTAIAGKVEAFAETLAAAMERNMEYQEKLLNAKRVEPPAWRAGCPPTKMPAALTKPRGSVRTSSPGLRRVVGPRSMRLAKPRARKRRGRNHLSGLGPCRSRLEVSTTLNQMLGRVCGIYRHMDA